LGQQRRFIGAGFIGSIGITRMVGTTMIGNLSIGGRHHGSDWIELS
jgi:hypothetical protein